MLVTKGLKLVILLQLFGLNLALANVEPTALLQLENQLEEAVSKKYRDRISTQLQNSLFNVSAQIKLTVTKEKVEPGENTETAKEKNLPTLNSELPADLALGILADALPGEKTESPPLTKDVIKITKVTLLVGLSPKLGKDYRAQFTQWLSQNVNAEFGSKGTAQVNDYFEIVEPEKDKDKDRIQFPKSLDLKFPDKAIELKIPDLAKPRPLSWEERFGHFQNLIGLSIVALFLLISFLLWKLMPSRDVKERNSVALKIQEMQAAQASEKLNLEAEKNPAATSGSSSESETQNAGALETFSLELFNQQQVKVSLLVQSSPAGFKKAVEIWMEQGELGRFKLGLALDCMMAAFDEKNSPPMESPRFKLLMGLPEKVKNDRELAKVFRSLPTLELQAKMEMLDKAYWELLSIQTMESAIVKQRFTSLAYLPPETVRKILNQQSAKAQAVAILHLPSDRMAEVTSLMPMEAKKVLLDQAFSLTGLKEADLDSLDATINAEVQREIEHASAVIELPKMVPSLLTVIDPIEEISLISGIVKSYPVAAQFLKQNHPSIYFIGEWPKDKVRLLFNQLRSNEILPLIQLIPDFKNLIFEAVPARTRAMLEADLGQRKYTEEEVKQALSFIRSRIMRLQENGDVDLKTIFAESTSKPQARAA